MSADKGLQLDKPGIPHRPSDATIMRSASGGAIMPYSFRRTLPDASQAAFSRPPEAHTLVMSDRPIVPPPASDRSSPNAPPGPVFSIAELARSWARVTGEAWEGILHRLGDWAITDAYPDHALLTGAETDTTFHRKVIYDRIRWHRELVEKIRRIADRKKRGRLQKNADIHMRAAEVAVLTRDVVLKACRAMNAAPPPILGLVTDPPPSKRCRLTVLSNRPHWTHLFLPRPAWRSGYVVLTRTALAGAFRGLAAVEAGAALGQGPRNWTVATISRIRPLATISGPITKADSGKGRRRSI
jgi:hypothetical protein